MVARGAGLDVDGFRVDAAGTVLARMARPRHQAIRAALGGYLACRAEVPAGASSASASSRWSRCPSMSGSGTYLANHRGWYQIREPMIAMTAGTSVSRTTNASRN